MYPRREIERDQQGKFLPGSGGRPPGSKDKLTRTLKECVLMAGEIVGSDGKGRDGLLGYLTMIARRDPKTYCGLLGRLMPIDVQSTTQQPVTYRTSEEVLDELAARGIGVGMMEAIAERARERERAKANGGGGNGTLNGGGTPH